MYDTKKTCWWKSFKFSWVVRCKKNVKIRFENKGSPCCFLSSRGQKIRGITKIEPKRSFLFQFLPSFLLVLQVQKLIDTINIWFYFVSGLFFEQDDLLNIIILEIYAKKWFTCSHISKQNLILFKIWSMIFFLTLSVRGPFHMKAFKWRKIWGYGVNIWKNGSFVCQT